MSAPNETELHRHAVQLATQVLAAATRARTSCVLLTSAEREAGKTALAERMSLGLASAGFQRHVVLQWHELTHVDPKSIPADSLVFIDGPALFAGVEILEVPHAWRARIDGAVVVVMKRQTRRVDLAETVAWLQAAGWPPIGVIWNLRRFPRWRLLDRLFGGRTLAVGRAKSVAARAPSPGSDPVRAPIPAAPAPAKVRELPDGIYISDADMRGRIIAPAEDLDVLEEDS